MKKYGYFNIFILIETGKIMLLNDSDEDETPGNCDENVKLIYCSCFLVRFVLKLDFFFFLEASLLHCFHMCENRQGSILLVLLYFTLFL